MSDYKFQKNGNPRTKGAEQSSYDGNPRTKGAEQSSHDGNPRTKGAEQSSYDGNPRTMIAEQSSYDGNPQPAKTILLVEDDKSLNKIILLKLKDAGYNVVSVEDAEKALEVLRKMSFDLIWLDIYLPGMNGFEFLEAIRKNPKTKDTKVAIVSVSGSNKKMELAKKFNVDDYFIKSNYRIEELVELVAKVADHH